jgi:hypothetical protein
MDYMDCMDYMTVWTVTVFPIGFPQCPSRPYSPSESEGLPLIGGWRRGHTLAIRRGHGDPADRGRHRTLVFAALADRFPPFNRKELQPWAIH